VGMRLSLGGLVQMDKFVLAVVSGVDIRIRSLGLLLLVARFRRFLQVEARIPQGHPTTALTATALTTTADRTVLPVHRQTDLSLVDPLQMEPFPKASRGLPVAVVADVPIQSIHNLAVEIFRLNLQAEVEAVLQPAVVVVTEIMLSRTSAPNTNKSFSD